MGRDHSPKERQRTQLARKKAGSRASFDRILIVTEGSQTEPNYFREICQERRIPTANVVVLPGKHGTAPLQVVEYAERLFREGDHQQRIEKKAFEQIYAVFDRDRHPSYQEAIRRAHTLDGTLKNDNRQAVSFAAIPSAPCFELWLLLHFEEVGAPLQPTDVLRRLQRHWPGYKKGTAHTYAHTRKRLPDALRRAQGLHEENPFTRIGTVVKHLTSLGLPR